MKGPKGQMGKLLKQAQKMQADMMRAQDEVAQMEAEGTAGGGAIVARVNGAFDLVSIKIDPEAVDPDDVETLEDLIMASVNQAVQDVRKKSEERMSQVTGGMPSMPGMPF